MDLRITCGDRLFYVGLRGLYRIDDHGETHALPYSRASDRGDRGFYVVVDLFRVLGYSFWGGV